MVSVIEFDFETKTERLVSPDEVPAKARPGRYYWLRAEWGDTEELTSILSRVLPEGLGTGVFDDEDSFLVQLYRDHLAFGLAETCFDEGILSIEPIKVILGESFLATLAPGNCAILTQVGARYHEDFVNFAQSPGFLLFELVDCACRIYQRTFRLFENHIERLQTKLLERVDEQVFVRVARTAKQLLLFHYAVVDTREVVSAIATRKSSFIAATTQPFLERKAQLLGRLGDDLSTQRDVISNTLNLYIGFVGYRTNLIINRLTIISLIFLPLTFLVGVYGMNFAHMPEIDWPYSYATFWLVVAVIVISLLIYFKKKRWLEL